ncbi:MAG: phosphoribosyl-ATP diphosphatase [Phycisphaeraceae bacterium]
MTQNGIFDRLEQVLRQRRDAEPGSSYVASLYAKGTQKINAKILEEAREVAEAAAEGDRDHLCHELCDLLFHALVQACHHDVSLEEIEAELQRRFGTSGHEEKANRSRPSC